MLGWINHFDFERSIINAEARELLVVTKSASHDIENNILRIKQEPQFVDKLMQDINDPDKFSTFIIDNNHIILSDQSKRNVGKNILDVGKEVLNTQELSKLNDFIRKLDSESSGTAILEFPTRDEKPKKETKLFAFVHFQGRNGINSLVVTERLSALTRPLRRNLRDTLLFVALFVLILIASGYIFYRIQKKRFQEEVTNRALEIINKQLRCDLDDYKCIEKRLKGYKR